MSDQLSSSQREGTKVARGQHTVPESIAVLEFLDGEHDKLPKPPEEVAYLLEICQLTYVYKYFISKFCRKGKTYIASKGHSCWVESRLVAVIQEFEKDFSKKKMRLALCIINSECGNYRWLWLEFIPTMEIPDSYTPKYDVTHCRLVLHKYHMIPTAGVEVNGFNDYDTKHFLEIPEEVKALLEPNGLNPAYQDLIRTIYDCKGARTWADSWKTTEILAIVKEHRAPFDDQDVELAVCKRPIGSGDVCKWIEIIDTKLVPSHVPVHSVDTEKRKDASEIHSSVRRTSHALLAVAVLDLVVDGQPKLSGKCPSEVEELLERKGLTEQYNQLAQAIAASKSFRNFCDLWRLTEQGLVSFVSLDAFKSNFLAKGIKLVLCESVGKSGRNYWLEYVNLDTFPDYASPFDVHFAAEREQMMRHESKSYTKVITGRHMVPEGVAVEEVQDKKSLLEPCSPSVQELLEPKGLIATYERCMQAIVNSKQTRNWTNNWHSEGIAAVLKDFDSEFGELGIKVATCKMKTAAGASFRWIEFIDTEVAANYVPQYDVSNLDEELETAGSKVQFPKGVVVEKLMDRKMVMESTPPSVNALREKKECVDLYNGLVDVLC